MADLKLGDFVVYPKGSLNTRNRYESQISAEIRIRDQMSSGNRANGFSGGGLVLQVVSVVTPETVESL